MATLLDPLQIKDFTLKNRLVMPPMATAKADGDGKVTQDILDYYADKTQGHYISLVIVEHCYVSPLGKASKNQMSVADDSCIPGLQKLADTIHQNGSLAVLQINHAGSAAKEEIIGQAAVGPSAVVHPWSQVTPRVLTKNEIAGIVTDFQNAARRVKEAGFDGVEIHSAHGYFLNQFFSPLSNKRSDEYGGTLANRIRIHLEIIEAVRSVVGEDFLVLLRLGASDYKDGGTTIEHSKEACIAFEKAGVNIIDISGGFNGFMLPDTSEQGYFAPLTKTIKQVVSVPVILTGGITDAQAANKLLAENKADLIGVGRAILHDSKWAQHAVESLTT